jgi:hypothetical protein
MRVENPRFNDRSGGKVYCQDCPYADEDGVCWCVDGCSGPCPRNMEEYTSACLMAEEAAKGGKG